MDTLNKEFNYFLGHHDELYRKYPGRHVVIKDEGVVLDDESFEGALDRAIAGGLELGTFALILHENVFNATMEALHRRLPADQLEHNQVRYGNERLHFSYKGYCFIFRMAGSGRNDTEQERLIRNQDAEQHVISIVYKPDALRESASSLCLQYEKGGTVVWECPIPLGVSTVSVPDVSVTAREAVKPKLKMPVVEKAAE